ncbi:MAG: type II 3-dehydroquinate dehydratase [Actinomycetota bacterium]
MRPAPPLVFVVNGPNLDKLGSRQPEIYGSTTLNQLEDTIRARASELGLAVDFFQSNDEDELTKAVADAPARGAAAILINPAALSHFSYPLRETLAGTGLPVVEVHISNIHAREPFRRLSLVSGVAKGVIAGLGVNGYVLALEAIAGMVGVPQKGARTP